ncbi:MAG: hypothetical protein ACREV6_09800 [Clostridium sp.]|uniref:hypothetical protein n=1 Tax=Clostridium sp. TaxID=1506 RepID=UPI003D6D6FD7
MNFYEEKGIGCCGLACVLCSEEDCLGCHKDGCSNKGSCNICKCCKSKDMNGCFECSEFPCDEKMMQNIRIRAFNRFAKEKGVEKLVKCLKINYNNGITYHVSNGLKGDYDSLDSEEEIIKIIEYGKRNNPFIKCPVYETDNLIFTKVKDEDAIELFKCYSDPITRSHINNDNCGGEWDTHNIDVVKKGIIGWKEEFDAKFYIRWSVTHKHTNTIIGTIEIAPVPNTTRFLDGVCRIGILRIDILSSFEDEEVFSEILKMAKDNFYTDFDIENIIIKATKDDTQRTLALENNRFEKCGNNSIVPYNDYYLKRKW